MSGGSDHVDGPEQHELARLRAKLAELEVRLERSEQALAAECAARRRAEADLAASPDCVRRAPEAPGALAQIRRQAQVQEAIARSLRALHQPGQSEADRRQILGEAARQLCTAAEASDVIVLKLSDAADGPRRLAPYAGAGRLPLPEPLPWMDLPRDLRAALEAWEGSAKPTAATVLWPHQCASLPDQAGICFLPLATAVGLWGCVALVGPVAEPYSEQRDLATTIVAMMQISIRRWLAVDALRASEAALRASETRLYLALDASRTALVDIDLTTWQVRVSAQFGAILGSPEYRTSVTFDEALAFVHPDDRDEAQAMIGTAIGKGEPFSVVCRILRLDGELRWVEARGRPVMDADEPAHLLGVVADISDRKRVEEQVRALNAELEQRVAARTAELEQAGAELRRSRDLLQLLLGTLNDGLILLDGQGRVMLGNQAAASLYGLTHTELAGRRWGEICAASAAFVAQTAADGRNSGGRFQHLCADGSSLTLAANCFSTEPSARPPHQVVLHLVDLSEQLQLERLAIQNERLAASGRLAAIVAHEVSSPLQAIQNFLFLADSDSPAERANSIELISEEIERIAGLVRRLLDIQLPGDSSLQKIDLNRIVAHVLRLLESILQRHHIVVEAALAPDLPVLSARPDQLTQVLLNLCLNAVDAMPRGGTLRVSTSLTRPPPADERGPPAEGALVLEVADSGTGIPEAHLARVFDLFFTSKTTGTGLGLAISRQIVEQHGGQIRAGNQAGGGALFRIVLPASQPDLNLPEGTGAS